MMKKFGLVCLLISLSLCYDPQLGKKLATLCYASYCAPTKIQAWSVSSFSAAYPDIIVLAVIEDPTKALLSYIAYSSSDNAIIVLFRGSHNLSNWMSNLDSSQTTHPGCSSCKVHKGFFDAYNQIKPYVRAELDKQRNLRPKSQVIVAGHSLGAALATLLAADLEVSGQKYNMLFTIGSPRVGETNYWNWYEGISAGKVKLRITNHQDPVVHMPGSPFYHINQEIFYLQNNYKICSTSFGEDQTCADGQSWNIFQSSDHGTYYQIDSANIIKNCQ